MAHYWRNNLNDVFHLNAGDKVSVYSSFVSESGAGTLDTIEIKGVSLKETKSFTYIENVTKEVLEGIGSEFTNGFLTNGIKGDFSQPIEAYYREITEDIELRDDEVNLIVEYYKTLDLLALEEKSIPLFIEKDKGLYLVPEFEKTTEERKELVLSYLGKKLVT